MPKELKWNITLKNQRKHKKVLECKKAMNYNINVSGLAKKLRRNSEHQHTLQE